MGALVPPEVSTKRVSRPTGTPAGTVVTIRRFVQSAALAMAAVSRPPAVVENTTCPDATRSEEHTSELQSLAYLVCRLLLEKKKKKKILVLSAATDCCADLEVRDLV